MRIAIASDHAGFEMKQALVETLRSQGHQVEDLGTHSSEPVDYPDFAEAVGNAVRQQRAERGIVLCGGGVGASVLEASDSHMVARLDLARAGIAYSLTTRNALHPWEAIDIQLEQGPFEHFHGRWQFQQLGDAACKVMLELRFAMAGVTWP